MSKQDRQGVRTATDLEQKYTFGKRFAEIMGIATDAQDKADNLEEQLSKALTSEEIFNILTENGALQGLFRGEDGELYVNAQYIVALEYLFAKDIEMSGKFTYKTKTFLEPGQPELDKVQKHASGIELIPPNEIPLYDFNNDGIINMYEWTMIYDSMVGLEPLVNWEGAVESEVTLTIDLTNPQKAFRITGTNMWGREIDSYMGVQGVSVKHTETADYVVEQGDVEYEDENNGTKLTWTYELWNSGKAVCYTNVAYSMDITANVRKNFIEHVGFPLYFEKTPIINVTLFNQQPVHHKIGNVAYHGNTISADIDCDTTAAISGVGSIYAVGKWK